MEMVKRAHGPVAAQTLSGYECFPALLLLALSLARVRLNPVNYCSWVAPSDFFVPRPSPQLLSGGL